MHFKVTSELGVCLSDSGFTMDELVRRMEDLFEAKAFPEILALILLQFDEMIRISVMTGRKIPFTCPRCGHDGFALNGVRTRTIKTRLGTVVLPRMTRVKCRRCGTSGAPLLHLCGLDRYQSKTNGLEKLVLEQCAQNSYRRANRNLRETTGVDVGHSTFHRWVLNTNADEIKIPEDTVDTMPQILYADGTKCKARNEGGMAIKGDIKVMLGVRGDGEMVPIGTWTGHETWNQIGDELEENGIHFPDGTILVSDGEIGLADSLARFASEQQRCHWHVVHDTYFNIWQNQGTTADAKPYQKRLKKILAIELPADTHQPATEEQKKSIQEAMRKAETEVAILIADLREKNFPIAANYLERARNSMFGYIRRWLSLGVICPRASSLIERTMREIARRIKRIAYNWKEKGLGKITRILLKIWSSEEEWNQYWEKRMKSSANVVLNFRILKA